MSTQVWPTLVVDLGAPLDARRAHEERDPRTVEADVDQHAQDRRAIDDHPHTIDRWDDATGENLIEQIAAVGDYLVALETYRAG